MQKMRPAVVAVVAIMAGGMALSGCATKKFVREQAAVVDAKVTTTQGQVTTQQGKLDAHETHLGTIDKTTKEALDRATAAGKLAEGKFLYTMVLSDDSVKFEPKSSELSPEAQQRLQAFAQKLKDDNRNVYLEIQGHSDNQGSKASNTAIAQKRAEAVRVFLNQQGVALNRMSTISYGGDMPVGDNKTKEGRAQNRRVVVVVLS